MKNFFLKTLLNCRGFFNYLGGVSVLFFKTLLLCTGFFRDKKKILKQMSKIGADSLPIVSVISVFTGMVLAFQSAYQMQKISAGIYIASLVALSLTRELAPVLTALIITGRIGASITAEIGSMKVTEQIDALRSLAVNPVKYLVVPRFYALIIMLPLLTVYSDVLGILGGYLVGVFKLNLGSALYVNLTFDTLAIKDIAAGLIKSFVFAIIICIVSCYEGLSSGGGAEGVGKATTASVVTSFVLIITSNCLLTVLFYVVS